MFSKEPSLIRIFKKVFHRPTRFPYFIQLAVTDACNLSCQMCPRHHVSTEPKHGEFETLKKIVDGLEGAEEISLVGLGEPLTHPRFFDIAEYCRKKGLRVKVTTNGLLVNSDERLARLISAGIDTISFSVEGIRNRGDDGKTHQNQIVLSHIERLIEIKKQLNADRPQIVLQSVLIKNREEDIYDMIRWAAEHHIPRVNLLRMTRYFPTGLERPTPGEEKDIFETLSRLRKIYSVRIDCLQDQFYTGVKGLLYKQFKNFLGLDSSCVRLLDYPYITREGDMIPCCVLPDQRLGNVIKEDIQSVWLGAKFREFRKHHHHTEICSKCDNLRIKQLA